MRHFFVVLVAMMLGACMPAVERVRVDVDALRPGAGISGDFLGLSYEAAQLAPRGDGTRYFSVENKPLVAMFRALGVRSLRIGGSSVDRAGTAVPTEADIDSLFGFARVTGVKVIYSVRLQNGEAAPAAAAAKYIQGHYADVLDCFSIGNEPSYYKPYENYREKWKVILEAMAAAAPGAKFCGPDTNPTPEWCKRLVEEFAKGGGFVMVTEHDYPGGCAYKNPNVADIKNLIPVDAGAAREKMLSGDWYARYATVQKGMADAVAGTGVPFRLTETNSLWYGGLLDASDSYASALWSVDYLYWWAEHGARGLNFHTGDKVGGGEKSVQSRYTAFVTTDAGFDVHAISYGMKLFDLGGHGRLVPVKVGAKGEKLSAYGTMREDGVVSVTLIHMAHGAGALPAEVEVALPAGCKGKDARVIFLAAPGGDIAVKTGVTVGGAAILGDGSWEGKWRELKVSNGGRAVVLSVPAASGAVVQVRIER